MAVAGCSTSSSVSNPSDTDAVIAIISETQAENCALLGQVTGTKFYSWTVEENIRAARSNAMNEAATLGADSVIVKSTDVENNGNLVTVTMDAYKCNG